MLRPRILSSDAEAARETRRLAQEARRASALIAPPDDGTWPQQPDQVLPFDGVNLNQPFDANFIDPAARARRLPPLPSRLTFADR
jgi:general secretion pathway protein D